MTLVPFNIPYQATYQEKYVINSLQSSYLSGDGPYTKLCTDILENIYNDSKVLLTPSCTSALEIAALLLDIKDGDEVILPSFTFVSTANAFSLRGAKLVFCDIEYSTKIISYESIKSSITSKTKAVVVVQYAGFCSPNIENIRALCDEEGVTLIEDAAQSIGAYFDGSPVGAFGHLSTISFHETKNLHCGEGGALVINDHQFIERAEIIREKGTNRSQFFRGEVDKYTWQNIGSSYLLSDLQASMLYAQLLDLNHVTSLRREQFNRYKNKLSILHQSHQVQIPSYIDPRLTINGHIFWLQFTSLSERTKFIKFMKSHGVSAIFHYVSLHLSPYGKRYGTFDLPETVEASDCLVRLPNYVGVNVDQVVQIVLKYFN